MRWCPECRDGKHGNCIGWTLDDDDREVDCDCDDGSHVPIQSRSGVDE